MERCFNLPHHLVMSFYLLLSSFCHRKTSISLINHLVVTLVDFAEFFGAIKRDLSLIQTVELNQT